MALRIKANIPPPRPSVTPQLASKHFDIVLGLDFHFLKVPWPITPCPITPFAAMVFDPMDYLHITLPAMPAFGADGFSIQKNVPMGGTVTVNGCYRAAATTGVLSLPPLSPPLPGKLRQMAGLAKKFNPLHAVIPKPLFWVPPLAPHDGEISHGSQTVITAGCEQSALFCHAFSCADIGRIVLNMPTGFFNNYATAIIAVLPFGKPVIVGGPFIEHKFTMADLLNALMMMGIMKGAGKLLSKALGKLLTKMNKALMEKFPAYRAHGEALQPHICNYLGEPVDVGSGHMASLLQGFDLPGQLPFKWEANYYSDSGYDGPLGKNIYHSYDIVLQVMEAEELILLRDQYGCAIPFPLLEPGSSFFNPRDKYTLYRNEEGVYTVANKGGLVYSFNHFADGEGCHRLRMISDRNGFAIRFNYDTRGRLVKISDSAHREILVLNDDAGRITSLQMPHPDMPGEHVEAVRYTYDKEGRMLTFHDARGYYNSLQWQDRLVVARRFKDGTLFRFEYNSKDQCTAALGPNGLYSYRFEYHEGYTIATNSLGYKSTYYHRGGIVTRIINSQGAETVYRYDSYRNLLGVQDELGRVKNYQYDERGNVTGIGLPGQGEVSVVYNGYDQPLQVTRPNGGVWQYTYDERGNMLEQRDAEGGITQYEYLHGLVSRIVNPAGNATRLLHNRRYELSEVVLPNNARVHYRYDELGRCVQLEDIYGNQQLRKYDLNNNITEVREADGNVRHIQYDAMDNAVRAADKLYQVELDYNFFGDITRRKQGGTAISFVYDKEGQLIEVRNEHEERYTYLLDSEGRTIRETGFDGVARQYVRDAAGQVIEIHRPGDRINLYEYNAAGRVIQVQYTDGATEAYEYNNDGLLTKSFQGSSVVSFERDLLGRVTTEVLAVEGQSVVSLENTYDRTGNRTRLSSSLGADIRIAYNNMGEAAVIDAGEWHSSFLRNEAGSELQRRITGGITLQWEYDRFGRPVEQQVLHGQTTHRRRHYTWGVGDRLLAINDSQTGAVQLKHDVYGNLSELIYGDGKTIYRLPDAVGNLFETRDRADRKYSAGGRLQKAKGGSYHYDSEGYLIRKETAEGSVWQYVWNDNGSLQKVIRPDGQEVQFGYDALGRRVWKKYKQTITRWVWDGNTPLHEWKEFDAHESTPDDLITWVFEADSLVPAAKLKGDKKYSIIADHLGTPKEMYLEDGSRFWKGEMDGYGRMRIQQGELGSCPFRYQGQYEDVETGLYYNRFRYYSAEDGIYISQDPVRLASGEANLYSYVDDPEGAVDLLGLATCRVVNGTKIYGKGQTTGPGHALLSEILANKLAMSGKFKEIHLNRSYEAITGHSTSPRRSPDVTAIDNAGRVHAIEVASDLDMRNQQNYQALTTRNNVAQSQLPPNKQGTVLVVDKPYNAANVKTTVDNWLTGI
ncbi:RHS repeat-associated core domain-containing protein [Deminuibacter soli]|uniref:RHS repeat protein n=1 Tax=Deminuibacter soli TaxID=2291815 RepID=A0A3E1NCA4_9BACT|nr:RHS repeat-associated core domain-containing protein [Deminuibacter soli]RFM25649.1 RHS repeat protein [Deminuibacter soli]